MTENRNYPQKVLVYLDQNFISDMAKLSTNARVRPEIDDLFETLHKAFLDEKLVVLRSNLHDLESSLTEAYKELIRSRFASVSHVEFSHPQKIRDLQIARAARAFAGIMSLDELTSFDGVFEGCPDRRVPQFEIDIDRSYLYANAAADRLHKAAALDELRIRILQQRRTFKKQLEIELAESRRIYLQPRCVLEYSEMASIPRQQYIDFVSSSAFEHIPYISLDTHLLAWLLTHHSNRKIEEGDLTDIEAIATFLPYCDIYATDRLAANLARAVTSAAAYRHKVYDSSTKNIRVLLSDLKDSLRRKEPVNKCSLSIYVVPDDAVKNNSFEFYRHLGNLAGWLGGKGFWTEIVAIDDGNMPSFGQLPFYGLQEVTLINAGEPVSYEDVVQLAKSRSAFENYFIITGVTSIDDGLKAPRYFKWVASDRACRPGCRPWP
jgi:hypothetical protein